MQASYAGVDATVTLQPIQYNGQQPLQLWQFGSDQRIYLYSASGSPTFCLDLVQPIGNGQPLILNNVIASDQTQMWDWNSLAPGLKNIGASASGTTYVIDNSAGGAGSGNKIQIWTYIPNANQNWTPELLPSLYLNSIS